MIAMLAIMSCVKDGKLVTSYGSAFTGDLEHWHYNTFRVRWRDRTLGKGYVLKDCAVNDIVASIRVVASGQYFISPEISSYLLNRRPDVAILDLENAEQGLARGDANHSGKEAPRGSDFLNRA